MVRLYVEYLDTDTTKLFERAQDYSASKRMAWGDVDADGDQDLLLQGPRLMTNTGGEFKSRPPPDFRLPIRVTPVSGVTWTTTAASTSSSLARVPPVQIDSTRTTVMAALPRSPSSPPLPTIRSVRPVMVAPLHQRQPRLGPIWMPMVSSTFT